MNLYNLPDCLIKGPISKQFIGQFLPVDPIIVEAGAHIGRDTVKMAKLWPQSTIYAFEPVPELYKLLQTNTQDYTIIHCSDKALSNTPSCATLYISGGRSTACSSLLKPKECLNLQPTVSFENTALVTTITLDSWAQEYNITRIDFMWLDMQGNELKALEGAQKILPTVKALFIEVNLVERYESNPSFNKIQEFLAQFNFKAIAHDMPKHDKVNVLFVQDL